MPKRKRPQRPAKMGRNWTFNELNAYNIRITTVDTNTFFGISELPAPVVSPVILNHATAPAGLELSYGDDIFFRSLHLTTLDDWVERDFAFHLLGPVLEIQTYGRLQRRLPKFPFVMNERRVYATPNASMQDQDDYLIMIVEAETVSFPLLPCGRASLTPTKTSGDREEPRLVADALAAFTADNKRRTDAGLPPIPSKRYIGLSMIRSAPRLYKITITQALLNAVVTFQLPAEETIIERFIPPVPNMDNFFVEGMMSLENRYICLQCFEALKGLL